MCIKAALLSGTKFAKRIGHPKEQLLLRTAYVIAGGFFAESNQFCRPDTCIGYNCCNHSRTDWRGDE